MYFASRLQAGRMLASRLEIKYRYENCVVVALNDGGVMVGAQIASALHCILTMMLSEEIKLPREPMAIGGITQEGNFVFNDAYSSGEIEELVGEFHGVIEQEKLLKMHKMNELLGSNGLINKELLKGHNIILVADGMKEDFMLDMAVQFLKQIKIDRLIVAVPIASVKVIDKIHITADEIYCLDVPAEYMDTNHYYDKQDIPDHATVINIIQNIIMNWR